ncbi:hypothetical protein CGC54_03575 [Capnocytophaga canimorsus]|uniref:Outer membrane protein beta-barrel domain-containing protein n=1 Tax=Capnocytophaga canimorsus TaxID=28188 RepID=A0AAC9Z226_9FLAO|nr:hypothetical protein CGC54_03575 [Capnocytophaga canimorsus]
MVQKITLFLFFFCGIAYTQTRVFTGTVSDSLAPLERANVLARPLNQKNGVLFAITDHRGRYRLELHHNTDYQLSVSYLGYAPQSLEIRAEDNLSEHHFLLKSKGEVLKEVVISYEHPIVIKKDTITYKVDVFTLGNERKMKDVLERLPGVEVDENGIVSVQGKEVTQMLVEGKLFFGGGSKLAIDNIPADAIDKIEVIDRYNEVSFLKEVSTSEDLAMNVLLKEEKKRFVFGESEIGANFKKHHLLHTSVFYYRPELNLCAIGNGNNFGKSAFSFQDLVRFQGESSRFSLKKPKLLTNLSNFVKDNHNMSNHKSDFGAVNYGFSPNDKLYISGFGVFSKLFSDYQYEHRIEHLANTNPFFEFRQRSIIQQDLLTMANVKLDYNPSEKEKWFYNLHWDMSHRTSDTHLTTFFGKNNIKNVASTFNDDNISLKQYLEWHKAYNEKHTITFVANHIYQNTNPKTNWQTPAFSENKLLHLVSSDLYSIAQTKRHHQNYLDVLFKHYWIVNKQSHLYFNIGSRLEIKQLHIREAQILDDNNIYDLARIGFGNDIKHGFTDAFWGVDYRFKIKKLVSKFSFFNHYYVLNTSQPDRSQVTTFAFEPAFESKYELNDNEDISFYYLRKNEFPNENLMARNLTLQSYNQFFKGNSTLFNEIFDTFTLSYNKTSYFLKAFLFSKLIYSQKSRNIIQEVFYEGINKLTTPLWGNYPEKTWNFSTRIERNIYRARLELLYQYQSLNYHHKTNQILSENKHLSHTLKGKIRMKYAKSNIFTFSYNKTFNTFKGLSQTKLTTDYWSVSSDHTFASFSSGLQYAYFKSTNHTYNQKSDFQILNLTLNHQKKSAPWGINLTINNVLNTKTKVNSSIFNDLLTEQNTHILPRIALLSIYYKL